MEDNQCKLQWFIVSHSSWSVTNSYRSRKRSNVGHGNIYDDANDKGDDEERKHEKHDNSETHGDTDVRNECQYF